ncbi:MAG: lipoprotein [Evtepia sp.]
MKKRVALLMAVILCLSLAACSKAPEPAQGPQEPPTEETTAQVQSIDLIGPWHLDSEKNDLAAFADSLDLFPGYGEWGAGMEIQSDGEMNWFIGAAGGSGTYTIEDDLLHAALVNDMDQTDMAMDFRILTENETASLAMDYQGMTIYWVYGGQEDAPASGNGESQDAAAYPGADVVEVVNLRGDETTIYKLADGTYMDRTERHFTYNGTDTWTDEGGAEWNEVAKD